MSFFRFAWLVLALCVPVLAGAAPDARVIVKLRADSSLLSDSGHATAQSVSVSGTPTEGSARMQRLGVKMGVPLVDGRQLGPRLHVAQAVGMSSAALAAQLARQPDVEYAVVDQLRRRSAIPNDPLFGSSTTLAVGQWYLNDPAADPTTPASINAVGAWDLTFGSSSVTVAVLDTGARLDHNDFVGKFLNGYNMIENPVRAGNGVGRSSDPSDLGDYLTQAEISADSSSYPPGQCTEDLTSSWHGMEVAGVVGAATNNAIGMASVGGNTTVLPVRVLGKCGGYDSDIIAGMRWAAGLTVSGISTLPTQAARVINLSLGSAGACSSAYQDAITEVVAHGVVVVASAGNEAKAVDAPGNCNGVIAVGALRHVGTKAGYSATGPEITISAPGGNCVNETGPCIYPILSASNSGTQKPVADSAGGSKYAGGAGTSFSAPMVSGTVALMLAVRPTLTPDAIRRILMRSARPFPTSGVSTATAACQAPGSVAQGECYCTTSTCGAGMLDASAAVAQAVSDGVASVAVTPAQPTAADTIALSGAASLPSAFGTTITNYHWDLIDGGGIVSSLDGDVNSVSVTAHASGAGQFQVRLTVTDDVHVTASTTQVVLVAAAPSSGGGGGGGALDGAALFMGLIWLGWLGHSRAARPQ
ncbi:MAG: S8 family serine peptidase [Burkholderiales bacterium]|nr:S8 family serine peptidase [Burkholderiales bacterium]